VRRREVLKQADADIVVICVVVIAGRRRCCGRRAHQRIQVQYIRLRRAQLSAHFLIVYARLFEIVDKVATRTVRAKADRVESAAQFGLVLRMACEVAQFTVAVCKLALVAVLARSVLLVWPAKFGFVARRRFADAAVQLPVLLDQRSHQGGITALERSVSVADVIAGGAGVCCVRCRWG